MAPHALKKRKLEDGQVGDENDARFSAPEQSLEDVQTSSIPTSSGNGQPKEVPTNSGPRSTGHAPRKRLSDADRLSLSGSYNTGLFNLQLEELLSELRPKYERRMPPVDAALRKLKAILEQLPERKELTIIEAEKQMRTSHGITIPFSQPKPSRDVKWKLAFLKPSSVNVVGSYALKTCASNGERLSVDLAVTMPSSLFQDKDYLNYRYHHKKAYYLACLAAAIKEAKECDFEVDLQYLGGNALQPILLVRSFKDESVNNFASAKCDIRVLPVVSGDLFPISKTLPSSNCVRQTSTPADTGSKTVAPTPFYNASVRFDCSVISYLKFTHLASTRCEAFRDACVLGRTWLRQRGFGSSLARGGFGQFEWSALMAILLEGGGPKGQSILAAGYDNYQLFKATLQFLSSRDLIQSPLLHRGESLSIRKMEGPQIIDGPRGMNILFKMTPWSYKMLRHDASTSLKMLNEANCDYFDATFILQESQPSLKYDVVARLLIPTTPPSSIESLDHQPYPLQLCRKAYQTLSSGLGDRVKLVHLSAPDTTSWSLDASPPHAPERTEVTAGFVLDSANASRAVDHGPAAEDKKAAAAFRQFWGEKAELRRFKDGSILESLVWSEETSTEPIFQQVVAYILQRHLGLVSGDSLNFHAEDFYHFLSISDLAGPRSLAPFQPLMAAFEQMEKTIRELEGLPLQVRQISRASTKLRYTSIETPSPIDSRHICMDPCDVVIQFEGSGRWPDDLVAIQRTKIAFLLKLSDLLEEAVDGLTARLGLENEHSAILNASFLDIVQPTGASFRLRIHHEREQTLLDRQIRDKNLDSKSREEAVTAMAAYNRTFVHSTSHTQALIKLCTRHPFLSPTIRLVKRWFGSHLLSSPHISDELIELLVARIFVQPYPWTAPSSATTGFLRTLWFLARWDWRVEPLIIDLSGTGDMTAQDVSTASTRFEAWRKIDPSMQRVVLFVASNLDPEGVTWTQLGPSKVVAARMTALARSASEAVKTQGADLSPDTLFTSPTTDYDFLLHMSPDFAPDGALNSKQKKKKPGAFKNLQLQPAQDRDMVGYDPIALYLEELRDHYTPTLLFFHSPSHPYIAALWNPSHAQAPPRPWKVGLRWSSMPVATKQVEADDDEVGEKEVKVVLNKAAIVNEIARLGGDMVTRVELVRE